MKTTHSAHTQRGAYITCSVLLGLVLFLTLLIARQGQRQCDPVSRPLLSFGEQAASQQGRFNYVIGAAYNLDIKDVSVFVRSWRRWSPSTNVIILTTEEEMASKADLAALFQEFSVQVIKTPPLVPPASPHMQRFKTIMKFLDEHGDRVEGFVSMDVTDAAVQRDPFADERVASIIRNNSVLFSLEGGPRFGGDLTADNDISDLAMIWAIECFGMEAFDAYHDKPVACSGVVLGAASAVKDLIATMVDLFDAAPEGCWAEQGVLNYILNYHIPAGRANFSHIALSNVDSPVYTMGFGFPCHMDAYGNVRLEGQRFVPPIIHQYNRYNRIVEMLRQMYPLTDVSTFDGDWVEEYSHRHPQLKEGLKKQPGKKDPNRPSNPVNIEKLQSLLERERLKDKGN